MLLTPVHGTKSGHRGVSGCSLLIGRKSGMIAESVSRIAMGPSCQSVSRWLPWNRPGMASTKSTTIGNRILSPLWFQCDHYRRMLRLRSMAVEGFVITLYPNDVATESAFTRCVVSQLYAFLLELTHLFGLDVSIVVRSLLHAASFVFTFLIRHTDMPLFVLTCMQLSAMFSPDQGTKGARAYLTQRNPRSFDRERSRGLDQSQEMSTCICEQISNQIPGDPSKGTHFPHKKRRLPAWSLRG